MWLYHLALPTVMNESSYCSTSSPAFDIVRVLNFSILMGVWASLVVQSAKNPPAMQKTWVWSLGWEHSLQECMAPHSSILAEGSPWTKESCWLQSIGSQRDGDDWEPKHDGCVHPVFRNHRYYDINLRISNNLTHKPRDRGRQYPQMLIYPQPLNFTEQITTDIYLTSCLNGIAIPL